VGEFLPLMGVFQVNTWVAVVATSGVVLSAAYALWLYRRVVFGDLVKDGLKSIADMDRRERAIFAPLVAGTILFGVYPALLTDLIAPTVNHLIDHVEVAQADWAAGQAYAEAEPAQEGE
jgi:NADH-quinone oxidoreductase subunit M